MFPSPLMTHHLKITAFGSEMASQVLEFDLQLFGLGENSRNLDPGFAGNPRQFRNGATVFHEDESLQLYRFESLQILRMSSFYLPIPLISWVTFVREKGRGQSSSHFNLPFSTRTV